MKHKKIFILAYARANLGDDLFIYMLLKKYPNCQFYIHIKDENFAKAFEQFDNITIISEDERRLTKENANEYDQYIYVGGSIFMEGGVVYNITEEFLEFMKECKRNHIPFHYISSNFGPAYTQDYVELAKQVYQNCTDICFRDKKSYEQFKEIPSVRYAPDLAFSYSAKPIEKKPNTVGISMIDLQIRKTLKDKEEIYYRMLINDILEYIRTGKKIYLFSFCKHEGDERTIEQLLERLPAEMQKYVTCVNYSGNLEEFLDIYHSMEYMVCARFHAMILSIIMNQKCRIMSYSDKIDNVIEDLNLLQNKSVQFQDLQEDEMMPLEEFEIVPQQKVKEIAKQAEKQLESLERFIEK